MGRKIVDNKDNNQNLWLKKLNANSIPNTYIHTLAEPRRVTRGITTTAGSAGMLNLPKKGA